MEKDDFLKKLEKLVAHAKSKHNTVDAGEINDFLSEITFLGADGSDLQLPGEP